MQKKGPHKLFGADAGHRSMEKNNSKEPAALNHWIYTWAYIKVPAQNEDQTPTAYSLAAYLTILWMSGLLKASEKTKTSIDRMFSDGDRSDLFRFLARCSDIIDPRVRKAVSHYGHVPLLYAVSDGTQHYPGTDTLWADKGNTFYAWICDKRGYFSDYNLNPESKGDLLEVCFNLYYMHAVCDTKSLVYCSFPGLSLFSTLFCIMQPGGPRPPLEDGSNNQAQITIIFTWGSKPRSTLT